MSNESKKDEETAAEEAPKVEETPKAEAAESEGRAEAQAEGDERSEEDKKNNPTARELLEDEKIEPVKKIKGSKNVTNGIAHIKATFNNTVVSITDLNGNVVSWGTAGKAGFKGSRKSTAYAASQVSLQTARAAQSHGMAEVEVRVQGPGAGRESAIRALQSAGLRINSIKDVTPIPHNGCRPRKRRRV